jgi:hypothetical protein
MSAFQASTLTAQETHPPGIAILAMAPRALTAGGSLTESSLDELANLAPEIVVVTGVHPIRPKNCIGELVDAHALRLSEKPALIVGW